MTLYDSAKKDFIKTIDAIAAENAPSDVESVKVEVVKRPTVQKIPNQLSLF